jgi:hypothetical protein
MKTIKKIFTVSLIIIISFSVKAQTAATIFRATNGIDTTVVNLFIPSVQAIAENGCDAQVAHSKKISKNLEVKYFIKV